MFGKSFAFPKHRVNEAARKAANEIALLTDESAVRFIHWPRSPKRPSPRRISNCVEAQLMIRHWFSRLVYSALTIAALAFASGSALAAGHGGGGGGHGGGGHGGGGGGGHFGGGGGHWGGGGAHWSGGHS